MRHTVSAYRLCIAIAVFTAFLAGGVNAQCNNVGQCSTGGLPADCLPAPFAGGGAYGAGGSFFCIGDSVGVYNTSSGNIDYSWVCWGDGTDTTFTGSFADTVYHNFSFRPDSCFSGSNGILSNTIYIFVADSCNGGCTVTWNSFPVLLRFRPHAEFAFSNTGDTVCVDDPVCFDLSNACINQSSADSIWWDFGGGGLPFDTSRLFNPGCVSYSTPGTRTITVYLQNACGSSSFSHTVYVKPPTVIAPSITLADSCSPASFVPALVQSNVDSLWWSSDILSDVITNQPDSNPTIDMTATGQHIIHLQAYGCCSSPQSVCDWSDTLTLLAGPVITPTPLSFCQDTITLSGSDFFTFAGAAISNYDWIFTGASPDTVLSTTNPSVFFPDTGTYNVTVFATSSCGIDTVSTTLRLNSRPQLNLVNTVLTGCSPFNVTISDTSHITQGFYWSAPGADLPNTAFDSSATFTYSSATGSPYTITVTAYTDSNSCPNVSQNIIVNVEEGADLSLIQPIPDTCSAMQLVFQDYFLANPHTNDTAYEWLIYELGNVVPVCTSAGFPPVPPSCNVGGGGSSITYVAVAIIESTCDSIALSDTFTYAPPAPPQLFEDTVCRQSAIIQFGYNPAGGQWFDSLGTLLTVGIDFFDPLSATQYANVFYYTYGATAVCSVTDTFIYYVTGFDVSAGPDLTFCGNDTCFTLAGTPAGSWWEGTGVTDNILGTYCPPAGIASDTVMYIDTNGVCITIDSMIITLNTGVAALFNLDSIACIGDIILLSDTVAGSSASWMIDTLPWINNNSISFTVMGPAGDHSVWLALTDSINGCTDTLQKIIHILAVPDAIFSLSPGGCDSLELIITDNSTFDSSVTYTWNYGLHDTNPDTLYVHAGINNTPIYQTIQLTASNQCGVATQSDSVLVLPIPHASFGTSFADTCSPALVRFSDNSDGCTLSICTYEWSINGTVFYNGVTPPDTFLTAGAVDEVYHIQLITTNACGSDTAEQDVIVHPSEVVAFFHTDNLYGCVPLTVFLTDFSTPINPTLLQWDFGDPGSGGNIDYGDSVSHTYTTAGDYTIVHVVDNYCGLDTATQVIHVYDLPTVSFTATLATCMNEPVEFFNTSSALTSYLWDFGDSTTSDNDFSPLHYFPQEGSYLVTLTGSSFGDSTNSCTSVATQQITVIDAPTASFALDSSDGCPPITVQLVSNSINAIYYTWKITEGTDEIATLIGDTHTFTFDEPGQYTITLTATDGNLCRDDTSYSFVSVYDSPVADFRPEPSTQSIFTPMFYFENLDYDTSAFNFYNWNFGDGSTDSNIISPHHAYNAVGTYPVTLIASNLYGCADTLVQTVEVTQDFSVFIPNSFSPDGNGVNDVFQAFGTGWTDFSMVIFNRWGDVVYSTREMNKPWNGKYHNTMQRCPIDVYVYKIMVQDEELFPHEFKGKVTLVMTGGK